MQLLCHPNSLTLNAFDGNQNSVSVKFGINKLAKYKCNEELDILLDRSDLDKVFGSVDKSFNFIRISQNSNKDLDFQFFDSSECQTISYIVKIPFSCETNNVGIEKVLAEPIKLKWYMHVSKLKNTIYNVMQCNQEVKFTKSQNELKISSNDSSLTYLETYQSEKIKLSCSEQIFICKINSKNLQRGIVRYGNNIVEISCNKNYMILKYVIPIGTIQILIRLC